MKHNCPEAVELLLNCEDIDINALDISFISFLLKFQYDTLYHIPTIPIFNDKSALHFAAMLNNPKALELLLSCDNIEVNSLDNISIDCSIHTMIFHFFIFISLYFIFINLHYIMHVDQAILKT